MTDRKLIPGRVFTLDGEDYTIPALSPRAVRAAQERTLDNATQLFKMRDQIDLIDKISKTGELPEGVSEVDLEKAMDVARKASALDFDTKCHIAWQAFARNYPDMTEDAFLDMGDVASIHAIAQWALQGEASAKKG